MYTPLLPRKAGDSMSLQGDRQAIHDWLEENQSAFGGTLYDIRQVLVNNTETHWLEYVPASYVPEKPMPLVLCMYAGGQDCYGQFYDTAWYMVAEQAGLIVVWPEAVNPGVWDISRDGLPDPENHDLQMIPALIENLKARYAIDPARIYMQGMSMGDLMSMQCGRALGNLLAGIGCCSGPTDPDLLYRPDGTLQYNTGALPVYQSRGVFDTIATNPRYSRAEINTQNRNFWRALNGCTVLPEIRTSAAEICVRYPGEAADLFYRNMVRHGHYQAVDDAWNCWELVFSRYRRDANGALQCTADPVFEPDRDATALADGSSRALVGGKLTAVGGTVHVKADPVLGPAPGKKPGEPDTEPATAEPFAPASEPETAGIYTFVPVVFLQAAFGAEVTVNGETAEIRLAGKTIRIAKGCLGALTDGRLLDMGKEPEMLDGQLYVPINFFAESILNRTCGEKDGAVYIKDGPFTVTGDFANILKEILC